MNQRLIQFLSAENLSQSQFADTIGVARASVSHIIAGRNKPGFDFIESMARHFPSLNIEWLIMGKGRMYKNLAEPKPAPDSDNNVLFAPICEPEPEPILKPLPEVIPAPEPLPKAILEVKEMPESAGSPLAQSKKSNSEPRTITRVMLFYDDNTFQELK